MHLYLRPKSTYYACKMYHFLITGQNPEPDEIEEMIDEADADGSGSINFPEFIELMLKNQTRGQTKDEIKQVQNLALTMESMFESLARICKQYMNRAIVVSKSATKPRYDRPIKMK